MDSRVVLAMAALVDVAACGITEESSEVARDHGGMEDAEIAPQSFVVGLDRATTAESVIPQIVEAGRRQLAAACVDAPGSSIRVFNPFASGVYADVPCASVLGSAELTGEATAAVVSDESDGPTGQAQQQFSPLGLGCGIFMLGATLFMNRALCDRPTARQPKACRLMADVGLGTLGVACSFL